MKRKAAIFFAGLLILCASTGCGNSGSSDSSKAESVVSASEVSEKSDAGDNSSEKTTSDNTSKTGDESKAESKAESKDESLSEESEDVIEATIDEDGNIVIDFSDIDEWSEDEDDIIDDESDDEDPEESEDMQDEDFISSYTILTLSPKDFKSKEKLPLHYVITSEAELNNFIEKHSTDYALKVEYTDDSFVKIQSFEERASDTIKNDLPVYDYLVIFTDHSNSEAPDVGSGKIEGNSVKVDLWVAEPTSDADKGYSCILIPFEKDFLKGKNISVTKVDPPIDDEEDVL